MESVTDAGVPQECNPKVHNATVFCCCTGVALHILRFMPFRVDASLLEIHVAIFLRSTSELDVEKDLRDLLVWWHPLCGTCHG